ncbi:MAG: hypothetical protein ACK5KV_06800 [Bacteroides graminisolvens]|jgi:hypothetical protein|uniref:hypothetical protein n=1 Tax=Bacteroides graminisolvens TaxID=477666 RepID=UPI003A862B85
MEPSHSPFGLVGQIARDTGWPVKYILRKVNYPMLILMWSDVPHYVQGRNKTITEMLQDIEDNAACKDEKKTVQAPVNPFTYFQ